jgi:hypothetical protein
VISAAITLAGALVVLAWMPGRPAARGEEIEEAAPAGVPAKTADRDAAGVGAAATEAAEG